MNGCGVQVGRGAVAQSPLRVAAKRAVGRLPLVHRSLGEGGLPAFRPFSAFKAVVVRSAFRNGFDLPFTDLCGILMGVGGMCGEFPGLCLRVKRARPICMGGETTDPAAGPGAGIDGPRRSPSPVCHKATEGRTAWPVLRRYNLRLLVMGDFRREQPFGSRPFSVGSHGLGRAEQALAKPLHGVSAVTTE